MARRKAAAIDVPATAEEALAVIEHYVILERALLEERLYAEGELDRIKAERDARMTGIEAQRRELYSALKSWWEAGGARDVAGRKRSAEFGGAKIGVRLTPPAVKFSRGVKEGAIVDWLKSIRWSEASRFLRRPPAKLDKAALIKSAHDDDHVRQIFEGKGVTVEQVDEFFIDAGLDEEAVRTELAAP